MQASKSTIAEALRDEILAAESSPFERGIGTPIPPMWWVGDGRSFKASNRGFDLARDFAALLIDETDNLAARVSKAEVLAVVHKAIANIMADMGSRGLALAEPPEIASAINERVRILLEERCVSRTYYFGCALFHAGAVEAMSVGPVSFEARASWLLRLREERQISEVSAHRIAAKWAGKKLRRRKDGFEADTLLDAIGVSPVACTVTTGKQSEKAGSQKALLASHLAMTSIALMWRRPSKVLEDMGLAHDGPSYEQNYAVSEGPGRLGSSHSWRGSNRGHDTDAEWHVSWPEHQELIAPIGEALTLFVDPEMPTDRPKILKTLFMSVWWFHEACREQSDLIAIAKFASTMDTLATGGGAQEILNLIEHRLGRKRDDVWLTNGQTPKQVVHEVYVKARSGMFHGSIKDFDHDWRDVRSVAELVARDSIFATLQWIGDNPTASNPKLIRAK